VVEQNDIVMLLARPGGASSTSAAWPLATSATWRTTAQVAPQNPPVHLDIVDDEDNAIAQATSDMSSTKRRRARANGKPENDCLSHLAFDADRAPISSTSCLQMASPSPNRP